MSIYTKKIEIRVFNLIKIFVYNLTCMSGANHLSYASNYIQRIIDLNYCVVLFVLYFANTTLSNTIL